MVRNRRSWTEAEKKEHLEAFRTSGMGLTEFARERGIAQSTLWNWLHERGRALAVREVPPQLVEVVPTTPPVPATRVACRLVIGDRVHLDFPELPPARWLAGLVAELRTC